MFTVKRLLIVGATIAITAATAACSGTTATKAAPTTAPATTTAPVADTTPPDSTPVDETPKAEVGHVGDTFTATGSDNGAADITVTRIAVSYATIDYQTPEHGMFLIITLKAKGTAGSFDVNPFDFYVTGDDGTHYEDSTYLGTGGTPALEAGTLHNGEHIQGVIVYDVNPKARHGKFAYSPNLDGQPIATWSF
jgi:Domain of unknown function (DUF4352)